MSRRSPILLTLATMATTVALTSQEAGARPFFQKGSVEFGLQLGGLFFLDDEAVPFDPAGSGFPSLLSDTFTYTAHGSYNFSRQLGLELALQLSPAEVNRLSIFSVHIDAIWHPLTHDWFVPFVGLGPSFSMLFPQKDYANDTDPGLNILAGVKLLPWDHIGFRADLRYVLRIATGGSAADGREDVTGHDLIASIGLFGTFGNDIKKKEMPVILDTDGDGILDQVDACPNVPGKASAQGCPDKDDDTLADDKDRCPDVAGKVENKGCPDTDEDSSSTSTTAAPTRPARSSTRAAPTSTATASPTSTTAARPSRAWPSSAAARPRPRSSSSRSSRAPSRASPSSRTRTSSARPASRPWTRP